MTEHDRLLSLASEQGQSQAVIRSILQLLGAPSELLDLPRVVAGLQLALRAGRRAEAIPLLGCDHQVWDEACNWLRSLATQPHTLSWLGAGFSNGAMSPERNPLVGRGVTVYGFPYGALWHAPIDMENEWNYFRLVAQLLAATQKLDLGNKLQAQRYEVFRGLRRLCQLHSLDVPSALHIWGSHQGFVAACKHYSPTRVKTASPSAEHYSSIARLVRYSNGEEPQTRKGGGGSHPGHKEKAMADRTHFIGEDAAGFLLGDPDDPDQLPGYFHVVTKPQEGDHEIPEPGELAPGELGSSSEIWVLDDDGIDRPYVADLLSLKGIEAHIVRSRQMLPSSYSQFTLTELRNLLFGASDLFEGCMQQLRCSPCSTALQLRMEAILLIHISLWLGHSATQVVRLIIVDREQDVQDGLTLIKGRVDCFSVTVRRPDQAGDGRWQANTGVREPLLHVHLPDLAGSAALIEAFCRVLSRSYNNVFSYKTEELETEARAVLLELGQGDRRYTLTKVRNYLFHQICSATHDVATASMLSGLSVPSSQTPRYYLQLDAHHLRGIYVRSLERVLSQVYACAGLAYEPIELDVAQRGAVGATHCLLPETVASNVRALAKVLGTKPKGALSDMLRWHNYYTLWTVQMFMMATGCRAIRNPLRHVEEFDPVLGIGALSDKDSGDRHMSRLICMPDLLRKQLTRYFQHCAEISRQLTGYLKSGKDSAQWDRGFFLRLEGGEIRRDPIRPGVMYAQMQEVSGYIHHRINAYRKFVRTQLTERGCPAEALAAYMGHWLRGEEPQDLYSSFCPAAYAQVFDEYLGPLLSELGWFVVGSPWRSE